VRSVLLSYALDTCQASANWSIAFWAPLYLVRYQIAPDDETAAMALLPAILGFVSGAVLGGWLIDRLRKRTDRAAAWVALIAMSGGVLMSMLVFNIFSLRTIDDGCLLPWISSVHGDASCYDIDV
jgi:MFS family permease